MKNIPNPTFSIPLTVGPNAKNATAKDLLLAAVDQSPQGGFDLATQRARNRVAAKLEGLADGAEIELEDSDYATAQEAVKAWRSGIRHKDIEQFYSLFGV